jgi:hypothetical protein
MISADFVPIKLFGLSKFAFHARKKFCAKVVSFSAKQMLEKYLKLAAVISFKVFFINVARNQGYMTKEADEGKASVEEW